MLFLHGVILYCHVYNYDFWIVSISNMTLLINPTNLIIMSKCLTCYHACMSILHWLLMLGTVSFARIVFCVLLLECAGILVNTTILSALYFMTRICSFSVCLSMGSFSRILFLLIITLRMGKKSRISYGRDWRVKFSSQVKFKY